MDSFPLRNFEEVMAEQAAISAPSGLFPRVKAWFGRTLGLKQADDFVPAGAMFPDSLPRTRYPYGRDIREGFDSNVVMSPVSWVTRNFTEAEGVVQRKTAGQWEPIEDHALQVRIEEPNAFYDGDVLWKATLTSYLLDGNAYWLKVRNVLGGVLELWYLPHFLVEPRFPRGERSTTFISHYEYRPEWGGPKIDVPVRDIVHLRLGLDPRNVRKGLSPLRTLLREVFTDEEAANFSSSILRNMGVPGVMITPKDGSALPTEDQRKELKQYMKESFTGDRRGEALVFGFPTEMKQFGFDPNQLMLANLRDISEERVCAAIGIPAAVVGFGAGLQQTKVGATMKELRRLAWVSCLIPHQCSLGKQVTRQLMPDFQSQTRRFRYRFDNAGVSAFIEEETERTRRLKEAVLGGFMRVDEARDLSGLPVDEGTRVYLRPTNAREVGEDAEEPDPPPLPLPSANGDQPAPEDEAEETLVRANRMLEAFKGAHDADT